MSKFKILGDAHLLLNLAVLSLPHDSLSLQREIFLVIYKMQLLFLIIGGKIEGLTNFFLCCCCSHCFLVFGPR